ncbi:MAG: TIGR00730 family Rossman fold protein [Candidatus Eremiobacteraeota bacterium]|nr:TIGR00730 family Rossman fold protein [Candidatus Eremiobacteraeota bacterium]
MKFVAVYCGSSPGNDPRYVPLARAFGEALGGAGLGLIYGGGQIGLMGALAEGVFVAGGTVVGVIPDFLLAKEAARADSRVDLRIVGSMHERKAVYYSLAGAFVALPGGIGTFEEIFEVLAWTKLGLVNAPIVLLDDGGFFDPLLALLDGAVAAGFLSPANRALAFAERTIEGTIARCSP